MDTEFLGNLVEQTPAAVEKAGELDARDNPVRVPAMVVSELYYGVANAPEASRETLRTGYGKLFESYPVVELDGALARRAGRIRGRHARSDSLATLDGADSAVAATALSYDEPVVSNDRNFRGVDGLTVETY
nr:PIN domain-containing protein [Halobacterium sp. TGN-42-S1]